MKKFLTIIGMVALAVPACAASNERAVRVSSFGGAPRATASVSQLSGISAPSSAASVRAATDTGFPNSNLTAEQIAAKNQEKETCLANNVGIGNTFVWASRFTSNMADYTTMIEDAEMPENNACFVKVELKSSDPRVKIAGFRPLYYQMGRTITCGSWADEKKLEAEILEAKKTARNWGTAAGVVGGIGLGVGIMEGFGNKVIGGKVEGQKALSGAELMKSQLLVLQKEDTPKYNEIMASVRAVSDACEKLKGADATKQMQECEDAKILLGK